MTSTAHRVGVYLAVVQFFFVSTWTLYVLYLPQLAAQAGVPAKAIPWILMLDQVVFAFSDLGVGVMADRMVRVVGKLGAFILGVTLLSCLAFLLLPFAAPHASAALFFALTLVWTVTSSALRAPPLVLLGKYAARPAVPWLTALLLFGLGAAGAIAPYLGVALRNTDPRLPFVLSSVALAAATLGILWAERTLARAAPTVSASAAPAGGKPAGIAAGFLVAVALLAGGYQVHVSLNSAPLYLRYAAPGDLPYLLPVFMVGFNLLMLPASLATRRYGGLAVMGVGGLIAALAALLAQHAGSLGVLITLQFIAGGAWGTVLMSAMTAALAVGHTGREGKVTGGLFALLALAAFARIAIAAAGFNKDPTFAALLSWAPTAVWAGAGLLLLLMLPVERRLYAATPSTD
ncbi:MAG: MFS transporter [Sulfurifustaceae bacterium]